MNLPDKNRKQEFIEKVTELLGKEYVVTSHEEIEVRSRDTVPERVQPLAFVYPSSTAEVSEIVKLANEFQIAIWPHSAGRNWGWGNSPLTEDSVTLILERMNKIIEVNEDLAYAVIEPGVTYEALNKYLKDHKIKLWTDCTGGPPKGSVLGNALDRGVGVTSYADHFSNLCGLEVVLPDGKIIRTGGYPASKNGTRYTYKWGAGPYIEGLFGQSNYGIVTHAGIWLMPEPESYFMFGFTMQREEKGQYISLLNTLRKMALDGVVPPSIHLTSGFTLLTILTQMFKEDVNDNYLTDEDMRRLDKKYGVGAWGFASGLYGRKEHVKAMRKIIVRELSPYGRLVWVDEYKVMIVKKMMPYLLRARKARNSLINMVLNQLLKASIPVVQALPHIFDIYKGVPTEYVLKRAYFKTRKERPESNIHVAKDQVGVMWFGPMVPNDGETVFEVMDCFRKKFAQHQFEFYITIMMISARTIVPFMGIFYRQEDASERERALAFYSELIEEALRRGYQQFRYSRLGWNSVYKNSPDLLEVNNKIKAVLDPNHIIAPGKFDIF